MALRMACTPALSEMPTVVRLTVSSRPSGSTAIWRLRADDLLARVVTPCSGRNTRNRRGRWLLQERSKEVQMFPQPDQSMARRSTTRDRTKSNYGHAARARESELELLRELPYGPAACKGRIKGRIHVRARQAPSSSEVLLARRGASTHVHHDDVVVPQRGQQHLLHADAEAFAIDWTFEQPGRGAAAPRRPAA